MSLRLSGTLFLDEVGNGSLPLSFQVKLLRHLEQLRFGGPDKETDARVIAATRRNCRANVQSGRLREDLFFDLNVVTIALPPLRERVEDLAALRDRFLEQFAIRQRRDPPRLTPAAETVLAKYAWPGNMCELRSVLERAIVLSRGDRIDADELSASLSGAALGDP